MKARTVILGMGNPILTHFENAFSIMIPPGERFFVHSVSLFEDRVTDAERSYLGSRFQYRPDDSRWSGNATLNYTDSDNQNFGLDFDSKREATPWGFEIRAFFKDPDGHLFEISELVGKDTASDD